MFRSRVFLLECSLYIFVDSSYKTHHLPLLVFQLHLNILQHFNLVGFPILDLILKVTLPRRRDPFVNVKALFNLSHFFSNNLKSILQLILYQNRHFYNFFLRTMRPHVTDFVRNRFFIILTSGFQLFNLAYEFFVLVYESFFVEQIA